MIDSSWNTFITRIRGAALRCNGKTDDAVARVNISVVVQQGRPILWEVTGACKVEPTFDIMESLAGVSQKLRVLNEKCGDPHRLQQVLQEAIDKQA